jgi:guanylate kinase
VTEPEVLLGAPGALLVIVSGPSGVGKDTVIEALRARPRDPDYHYVVTCTTRGPRSSEVPGVSYQFLTPERFHALREAGELLEANEVHGNWYGTPRREVAQALADGHDVILKIDVQGAMVVKQRVPEALLVFLVPPSLETLFQRLRSRATETADQLEIRQRNAAIELARQGDYDRVVVNEDGQVDRTAAEIEAIIAQEKTRHAGRRIRIG